MSGKHKQVLKNEEKTSFVKYLDIGEQFEQDFDDFKPVAKPKKV